jgi:drug/metabolite transporter (DMT)-like permease
LSAPATTVAAAPGAMTLGRARVSLLALTLIWGSTFVVIEAGLGGASPFALIAVRFAIAAVALVAIRPSALLPALRATRAILPLTLTMLLSFGLQTAGLQTTTPARSAFLTSLMVVFVPGIEVLYTRRAPAPRVLGAVVLATLGVFALFHPVGLEWRFGDSLTLLSALTFGYYVSAVARAAPRFDAVALVLAQSLGIAALAVPCALLFESPRFDLVTPTLLAVAYLGVVCTAFTFTVMTRAQAVVAPVEASVLYTLEPAVAAGFSLLFARDVWRWQLGAGGALLLVAALVAATSPTPESAPDAPA